MEVKEMKPDCMGNTYYAFVKNGCITPADGKLYFSRKDAELMMHYFQKEKK